mgnify:CR=1 FL=1
MAHLHRLIRLLAIAVLTVISAVAQAQQQTSYPATLVYRISDREFTDANAYCRYRWDAMAYEGYTYVGPRPIPDKDNWFKCVDRKDISGELRDFSSAIPEYLCKSGGSLQGHICLKTCPEGQELQPDGTCKPKENTCKYADNEQIPGVYSMPSSFTGYGGVCLSGCHSWFVPYRDGASSDGRVYGRVFSYGKPCVAGGNEVPSSAPNEDPRTKCIEKGMHYGESNGVIVCVPKGNSGGGNQGGGNQGGGNNGGNGGNQGGGNQGGGNQGGDSGGGNGGGSGGGGGGNGSGNGGGGGNGSGNGSGGGGGGGKGGGGKDEGKENEYCKNNPDALACLKSGTPTEEEGLPRKEIGIKGINPFSLGGPGACPANIELPHGAYVTFETVCQYARAIRPFLLLFAWISAFYIVFPTRGRD